jgi:hypothetical protein
VASIARSSREPGSNASTFGAIGRGTLAVERWAVRTDTVLLVLPLFLARFTLPVGKTFLALDLVPISVILMYQFLGGRITIQYDRLLWFLGVGLMATVSLLLNFNTNMLLAYAMFLAVYFLFTFSRSSTSDQYKRTLYAFQFIVALLSFLGVVQFAAQFVVDGTQLLNFYGVVPDFLFSGVGAAGAADPRLTDSGIIKATGLFLTEPSQLSQLTALGILMEIMEFRRPRYLLVMALGFLLAYSGTGLMLLLMFLPLVSLRRKEAMLSSLFVVLLMVGLVATGVVDLTAFTSRVGEFGNARSSGFERFVAPFWEASKTFDIGSLQGLVVGHGPGTIKTTFKSEWFEGTGATWFKLFYEYGLIGSFIVFCFLASCVRGSRCPGIVIATIIFAYVFLQASLMLAIPLCTLNGSGSQRRRLRDSVATPEIAGEDGGRPIGST